MKAHISLNLFKEFGKRGKMQGLWSMFCTRNVQESM